MADEGTVPKQVPLTLDSEILEEVSTISLTDQPGTLGGTVQSVSVPSATEANSPGIEIHRVDVPPSDDNTLQNGASSSTPDASHGGGGVQEDGQHPTQDEPSNPLLPRYETDVPIRIAPRYGIRFPIKVVDYGTYEPPTPPQPSWIQCMCCCFLTAYYIHYARKIRNYKYMSRVRIALLSIPMSAFYIGITNMDSCPFASFSPLLLSLSGPLGIFLFVIRALIIADRTGGTRYGEGPLKKTAIGSTILLMLFMTIEMMSFYTMYPNFENTQDPFYCKKTFYYYVYYMNFVVMAIGILALLLHIPMKPSDPVQVVPLEYFETI